MHLYLIPNECTYVVYLLFSIIVIPRSAEGSTEGNLTDLVSRLARLFSPFSTPFRVTERRGRFLGF